MDMRNEQFVTVRYCLLSVRPEGCGRVVEIHSSSVNVHVLILKIISTSTSNSPNTAP